MVTPGLAGGESIQINLYKNSIVNPAFMTLLIFGGGNVARSVGSVSEWFSSTAFPADSLIVELVTTSMDETVTRRISLLLGTY